MTHASFVLQCTINGEEISLPVPASKRMTDILRDDLQLTGTKVACEVGRCGACMVLLDHKPVNACLLMAYQASGRKLETIESISESGLHPIQTAMLEEGGLQCGYCSAGMVVSLVALWKRNDSPTREQTEEALCGNLCRCTGYEGIMRAVERCRSANNGGEKLI